MSKWEGKSKVNPLALSFYLKIIKATGTGPAYFLLYFIAGYYFLFSRKSNHALKFYYRRILGYSRVKSLFSRYISYLTFGRVLVDKVAFMAGIEKSYEFETDGIEHLKEMAANKKGGILISAHLGNWEVAGQMLKDIDTKVNVVMLDEEHEAIKASIDGITGKRAYHIIPIKKDQSHIYKIGSAIANHEIICLHGDRFIEGAKTISSEFLGMKAKFPLGPFNMASRMAVPTTFVFGFKGLGNHYHLSATPPLIASSADEVFEAFKKEVEDKVRKYPRQWFNFYDFWA